MRTSWILSFCAACSATTPSENPFTPVEVATKPAASAPVAADATLPGSGSTKPDTFSISSEQLQANAAKAAATGAPAQNPLTGTPLQPETPTSATPAPAAATPAPEAPASTPAPVAAATQPTPALAATPSVWPVRLVKTVPNAQPPRAILSLPDGKEVVVTPGSLLADQGIVVLAIGTNNAQLAQITPTGDHTSVTPITLTAQY